MGDPERDRISAGEILFGSGTTTFICPGNSPGQPSDGQEAAFWPRVQETAQAQAERLAKEWLKAMKWTEKDLSLRRKGDPGKVRLAYQLRAKTTVPLVWIAERLKWVAGDI